MATRWSFDNYWYEDENGIGHSYTYDEVIEQNLPVDEHYYFRTHFEGIPIEEPYTFYPNDLKYKNIDFIYTVGEVDHRFIIVSIAHAMYTIGFGYFWIYSAIHGTNEDNMLTNNTWRYPEFDGWIGNRWDIIKWMVNQGLLPESYIEGDFGSLENWVNNDSINPNDIAYYKFWLYKPTAHPNVFDPNKVPKPYKSLLEFANASDYAIKEAVKQIIVPAPAAKRTYMCLIGHNITYLLSNLTKTYTNSTWNTSKTWYIKVTYSQHTSWNVVNYVTVIRNNQYKNVA